MIYAFCGVIISLSLPLLLCCSLNLSFSGSSTTFPFLSSTEVIAIGSTCWKDLGNRQIVIVKDNVTEVVSDGKPWCKIGDKVYYQRYSGMRIPNEMGKYRTDVLLLGDQDVTALSIEVEDERSS